MPRYENAAALAGDHGVRSRSDADRIRVAAAEQPGLTSAPYSREVADLVAAGRAPNVYVFAGADAWKRAARRREQHGPGSALVLPQGVDPLTLKWPAVPGVLVQWEARDFDQKVELARALVRDGVAFVTITHSPDWISARAKAVA